jgi:hypothetical protein
MHDPFIELELWGESGSVSLRVSQIVAVEEAPAMEAHPHLNLPFIGPRRRITTRAGAVHLVEDSYEEIMAAIKGASAAAPSPQEKP